MLGRSQNKGRRMIQIHTHVLQFEHCSQHLITSYPMLPNLICFIIAIFDALTNFPNFKEMGKKVVI